MPYSRTTFAKVKLTFPNPDAHISLRRQHQFGYSTNCDLRTLQAEFLVVLATRSGPPSPKAQRNVPKLGPLSLPKLSIETCHPGKGNLASMMNRLRFRGTVRCTLTISNCWDRSSGMGNRNYMTSALRTPGGIYMNWYIKAKIFHQVTGRPVESLQELWLSQGPTSAHTRAFN